MGLPALLSFVVIVAYSLSGGVTHAGEPSSPTMFVTNGFRVPGPLGSPDSNGWTVPEGSWVSDGTALRPTSRPAMLEVGSENGRPASFTVHYLGSPAGSELHAGWWPNETWIVAFTDDDVRLIAGRNGRRRTVRSIPWSEALGDSPTVRLQRQGSQLRVELGTELLLDTSTSGNAGEFKSESTVVATKPSVALDRVELEVPRPPTVG